MVENSSKPARLTTNVPQKVKELFYLIGGMRKKLTEEREKTDPFEETKTHLEMN